MKSHTGLSVNQYLVLSIELIVIKELDRDFTTVSIKLRCNTLASRREAWIVYKWHNIYLQT